MAGGRMRRLFPVASKLKHFPYFPSEALSRAKQGSAMTTEVDKSSEHPGWAFFRSMGSPRYHVAPMARTYHDIFVPLAHFT